jgi:hypothetical protein
MSSLHSLLSERKISWVVHLTRPLTAKERGKKKSPRDTRRASIYAIIFNNQIQAFRRIPWWYNHPEHKILFLQRVRSHPLEISTSSYVVMTKYYELHSPLVISKYVLGFFIFRLKRRIDFRWELKERRAIIYKFDITNFICLNKKSKIFKYS